MSYQTTCEGITYRCGKGDQRDLGGDRREADVRAYRIEAGSRAPLGTATLRFTIGESDAQIEGWPESVPPVVAERFRQAFAVNEALGISSPEGKAALARLDVKAGVFAQGAQ